MFHDLSIWLVDSSIIMIGIVLIVLMLVAAYLGHMLRLAHIKRDAARPAGAGSESHEGYIVSAVLGLLSLLLGFTFALAVDRFDTRRVQVLVEANDIGTTYLRAQLLEEPHRSRISALLTNYTDNRIKLARVTPDKVAPLLERNDELIVDLWRATVSAFPTIRTFDFSSSFIETMNAVIDDDAARKAARAARVPPQIFTVLFVYMIVSATVMGYVLIGRRGRVSAAFLLALFTLSLMLILDINRPTRGTIRESQASMEELMAFLIANPPASFDIPNRGSQ